MGRGKFAIIAGGVLIGFCIIGYSIVQSSLVGNREAAIPAMAQIQNNEDVDEDIENDIIGGADDYTYTKSNHTEAIETGDKGEDDLVNDSTIDKNSQGTTENPQPTGDRQLPEETTSSTENQQLPEETVSSTEDQQQLKANNPSGKDLATESKDLIDSSEDLTNSEANTNQNTDNSTGDAGSPSTPSTPGQGSGSQQSGGMTQAEKDIINDWFSQAGGGSRPAGGTEVDW